MPTCLEELTLCSTEVHLLFFLNVLSACLFLKNIIAQNGEAYAVRMNNSVQYIYFSICFDLDSMCGTLITACYIGNEGVIKMILVLVSSSCSIEMAQTVNTPLTLM